GTASTQTATLSLHDALPISSPARSASKGGPSPCWRFGLGGDARKGPSPKRQQGRPPARRASKGWGPPLLALQDGRLFFLAGSLSSAAHTSELQSLAELVRRS